MSGLSRFMKQNKTQRANATYAPTKSLVDENGEPLKFEFKALTSKRDNELRDACTVDVPVTGKPNLFRPRLNVEEYITQMIVESTVVPDLYNSQLQDSYGVKTPKDLLFAMVDNPGEYRALSEWIQRYQGFADSLEKKRTEAKN